MKQPERFFLCLCVASVLTSCNAPFHLKPDSTSTHQAVAQQYQTVSAFLTATALATSTAAPVAEVRPAASTVIADVPQGVPLPQPQATPSATGMQAGIQTHPTPALLLVSATPIPKSKQSGSAHAAPPCDMAQPGRILDVSVPDDTQFQPGAYLSKTWRLVNAGSCPWTRDYAVVWFSGDDLGVTRVQRFETSVVPGQTVDVTVDMVAPQAPGTYQSNWKLRNAQGALFGIGPASASPFWVRIVVVPIETPAVAAPIPTATAAPAVLTGGNASLTLDTMLDLDTGQLTTGLREDLALQRTPEDQLALSAMNGARLALYGANIPDLPACLTALSADAYPAPDGLVPGTYYCYRTTDDLPGWFQLIAVNQGNSLVDILFATWAAP